MENIIGIYNKVEYKRVQKRTALKSFISGIDVLITSSKLTIDNTMFTPFQLSKVNEFNENVLNKEGFNTQTNSFYYYNCNSEVGNGIHYYIPVQTEKKEGVENSNYLDVSNLKVVENNTKELNKYFSRNNKETIIFMNKENESRINFIKDNYNFPIYTGYVFVECSKYNNKYNLSAYTDIKGKKDIRLFEQKHYSSKKELYNFEEAIIEVKKAIKYLHEYITSNFLENKPVLTTKIYNHTDRKNTIFNYKDIDYIDICSNYIPCLKSAENVKGNTLFRIDNRQNEVIEIYKSRNFKLKDIKEFGNTYIIKVLKEYINTKSDEEKTLRDTFILNDICILNIDNYCSDLYVKKTDITEKIINEYEFKRNVTTFKSEIDSKIWYDIPFGYSEYKRF